MNMGGSGDIECLPAYEKLLRAHIVRQEIASFRCEGHITRGDIAAMFDEYSAGLIGIEEVGERVTAVCQSREATTDAEQDARANDYALLGALKLAHHDYFGDAKSL